MTDEQPDPKLAAAVSALADRVKALVPVNGQQLAAGGGSGGANKGDVLAAAVIGLLTQIRDGIRLLVLQAAAAGGANVAAVGAAKPVAALGPAKPPPKKGKGNGGYGWGQAFSPITQKLGGTRLGQIGGRFLGRTRPAAKALGFLGGAGGRAGAGAGAALGGAGAGAGGAAGAGAGGAAAGLGAAAAPIGIMIAAAAAIYEVGKAGKDLAYEQERYARALAPFSAQTAANLAALDAGRAFRSADLGNDTAGTGQALTRGLDRFEKAVQPFERLATNLANVGGAVAVEAIGAIAEKLGPLVVAIEAVAEKLVPGFQKGGGGPNELFGDFLADIARREEAKLAAAGRRLDATRRADRR